MGYLQKYTTRFVLLTLHFVNLKSDVAKCMVNIVELEIQICYLMIEMCRMLFFTSWRPSVDCPQRSVSVFSQFLQANARTVYWHIWEIQWSPDTWISPQSYLVADII
jgi:hypothetical protein